MPLHGCLKTSTRPTVTSCSVQPVPPRAESGHLVLAVEADQGGPQKTQWNPNNTGLMREKPCAPAPQAFQLSITVRLEFPGLGPVILSVPSRVQHSGARVLCVCVIIIKLHAQFAVPATCKRTAQWHQFCLQCWPATTAILKTVLLRQTETLHPLSNNTLFPLPPAPGHLRSTSCLPGPACCRRFTSVEQYNVCPCASGSSH